MYCQLEYDNKISYNVHIMKIESERLSTVTTFTKISGLTVAFAETTDIAINNISHENFAQHLGIISIGVVIAALSEVIRKITENSK